MLLPAVSYKDGSWQLLDSNLPHPVTLTAQQHPDALGGMRAPFEISKLQQLDYHVPEDMAQPQPYMEKQEKAICLVNAFNMALSKQLSDGELILDHIQQTEDTPVRRRIQGVSLQKFYTPNTGNFKSMIVPLLGLLPME